MPAWAYKAQDGALRKEAGKKIAGAGPSNRSRGEKQDRGGRRIGKITTTLSVKKGVGEKGDRKPSEKLICKRQEGPQNGD